ncbi:hypothetical protein ACS3QZ_08800 [Shimia sp. W99]
MIEVASNARTARAYHDAHAARGQAFVSVFKWLFARKDVPLSRQALTEPSRCA